VAAVANASYRDEPDLIVVEVESDAVPAELRVEDCYASGQAFPHVYGPIPMAAVSGTTRLTRARHGDWEFTVPGDASAPASTDR
jgi:glutathione S-transferase